MEHVLIFLPKSEVEIKVTLPFSEFEPQVKRAAVLISEEHEIEGFRKGKAPYEVVKNRFGESAIYERAADLAVGKTYAEVLQELVTSNQLPATNPPIGNPEITVTKLAPGNELEYKIKLVLLPTVTLSDYRAAAARIRGAKQEVLVSEEELTQSLQWLQDSRVKRVTVERPARVGDAVEIDFEARHAGVRVEGGASTNHPLIIGKGKFLPGFEDELVGMKAGEEKLFTLAAPAEWREKALAGKVLDFKTTMKLVQEREVPPLDDDFAKNVGDFASLGALQESVRRGLLQEKQEKEKQRVRGLMIEAIARDASMEIPEILVTAELKKMIEEARGGIEGMGMRWEDYLLHIKKSAEDLMKEWYDEAVRRVRIALCLREIARQEKIEVSEEEGKKAVDEHLARYRSVGETTKAVDPRVLAEYTRSILKNEKVFELLEGV